MKGILLVLFMKLITGLMLVLLAGCASTTDKDNGLSTQKTDKNQIVDTNKAELDGSDENVTAISPEVLYLLMTAEIAGQRNQYGVALDGYLQAAKRVEDPRIPERAAKIGLFLKDTKKTDEAVSLWLKHDDKNLTARKIAVFSAMRKNDKEAAVEHLSRILQEDPAGFESTLMELSKIFGKEGKADLVFDVLEDVSMLHQQQASVFFVQAVLAGQLKKLDVAKEKVNKALLLQPDWDRAQVLQAQLSVQSGDLDVAREVLEKVLVKAPENVRVRKMLAQVLMKTESFDDALQLYQDALKSNPNDGGSQFAIALIHLQQNQSDDALVYLHKLINKPKWDAQASFYIGRIEYKKEHYETALVWFDKVTQGAYVYDASMSAVSVLLKQKNFAKAEARLLELSNKYPKQQLNILLLQAEIYNEQEEYQKAFELLTDGLKKIPDHKDLLYTRALIAEKMDRLDLLEADLKKILIKHPEDANVLNALGYTLADKTERYEEAEVYLLKALKLKPEEAVIIDSLGWLQYKTGNTAEAVRNLRRAYEKQPESEIAAHLVEILWVMGNKADAKKVFWETLKRSPDDKYLIKLRQQFPGLGVE